MGFLQRAAKSSTVGKQLDRHDEKHFATCFGEKYTMPIYRPLRGDYRDVCSFAGQHYEVDPFEADIHLIDDITGLCIGRPFVILVVDRYSGMIVGFYVTMDDPDFAHIGRALHAAFADKRPWFQTIGLTITEDALPCSGMPESMHSDNGGFMNKLSAVVPELISEFGVARGYRGDDKPQVESSVMITHHGHIHLYGMGVSKGPKERAKRDPTKDAYLSVQTFTRELARWVVETANHRIFPAERWIDPQFLKTRQSRNPYNIWRWSVEKLGGPPRRYVPKVMMPRLLEKHQAKLTEFGLDVKGVYFDIPADKAFQEAKGLATHNRPTYFDVYIDELTTRQVYIVPDDPFQEPIVCALAHIHRGYADLTFKTVEHRTLFAAALDIQGKKEFDLRESAQRANQRTAAKADLDRVKAQHGSIAKRNKAASSIDKGTLLGDQIDAQNQLNTEAMHGPSVPSATASPSLPKSEERGRPSCF